jgi:hypothetical protein
MLLRALVPFTALSLLALHVEAQEGVRSAPRVAAHLALGFGGELDTYLSTRDGTNHGDVNLDPSFGFGLRGELPVHELLAVGLSYELVGVLSDTADAEREELMSLGAYLRGRWVVEALAGDLLIEPYVLVPIGFSMAILPDPDGSGDEIWPGWNGGVMVGGQLVHRSGFGGYLELGWRHAEVYDRTSVTIPILGTVTTDASLVMNELAVNVGLLYAFGG